MRRIAWLLPLTLGLVACDDDARERVISRTRVATVAPKRFHAGVRSRDRFPGFPVRSGMGEGTESPHGSSGPASAAPFTYAEQEGWHAHPPQGMRLLSFHVGGGHGAECSVVHLPGGGGGTLANVNRWHGQMGVPKINADALAKLPTTKVLGREGVLVELEGTYTGMGDGAAQPDHMLLGVIVPHVLGGKPGTLFIKMVGPKAAIAAERERLQAFCASLAPASGGGGHASPHGAGDSKVPEAAGPPPPAPIPALSWTAPAGWAEGGPKPMREVTFTNPKSPGTECYVSVLRGPAGGVADNINRWRKQVGLAALSAEELAALEKVPMLGQQASLLEATGAFEGPAGEQTNHTLMGVVCPLPEVTVFVKMIGPKAEVAAEREGFLALCKSLKQESGQ